MFSVAVAVVIVVAVAGVVVIVGLLALINCRAAALRVCEKRVRRQVRKLMSIKSCGPRALEMKMKQRQEKKASRRKCVVEPMPGEYPGKLWMDLMVRIRKA